MILRKALAEQHNEIMNDTITKSQTLYNEVVVKVIKASRTCLININTLTDEIRSGDSTTDQYCSTAIVFSCHG